MANKSGIHIKPSHRGLLTKEVGKKGLSVSNLRKEIARDKASGNTAREKREVFALNAKTKFHHHKDGGHVEGERARPSLAKRARGGAFSCAHDTTGPEKGPEPATLKRGGRAKG
jgi:hypothetical protein